MLSLFLVAALAEVPAVQADARPALATVRIVRGSEIRFHEPKSFDASLTRRTNVRERDGTLRSASLIEFY